MQSLLTVLLDRFRRNKRLLKLHVTVSTLAAFYLTSCITKTKRLTLHGYPPSHLLNYPLEQALGDEIDTIQMQPSVNHFLEIELRVLKPLFTLAPSLAKKPYEKLNVISDFQRRLA